MRTVGVTQFVVASGNPISESAFGSVRRTLRQSIVDLLPGSHSSRDLPASGTLRIAEDQEVELSMAGEDAGPAVWTCNWSHPDTTNRQILRKERIQLAQLVPGNTQLEILELASLPGASEEQLSVPPTGIPFAASIIQNFNCFIEERPISSIPRLVADETVVAFVKDDLTSPRRRLPLVLISKDSKDGTPSLDPTRVARITAGLAEVFLLQDDSVAMGLSDLVPRRLACVNGAFRIYNPGLTLDANPLHHPLTLGDTVKSWRKTAFDPEVFLLERLAKASAISHSEGSTIQQARKVLREQLGKHLVAQRSTRAGLEEQVNSLKAELTEKDRYVRELEDELERQRRLWFEYRPRPTGVEAPPTPEGEGPLPAFESVHSALQHAAAEWPNDVVVLQSAWDSARSTESRRRTEVFTAIAAVREIAVQHFAGVPFGQNLENLVRQRYNLRYRTQDHKATVDEYGDYRRFQYNGRRTLFENHITIGPNSDSCLQIYFLLDSTTRKVVIGYCGRHLPTKGWES
jgi:hypothetical protein